MFALDKEDDLDCTEMVQERVDAAVRACQSRTQPDGANATVLPRRTEALNHTLGFSGRIYWNYLRAIWGLYRPGVKVLMLIDYSL